MDEMVDLLRDMLYELQEIKGLLSSELDWSKDLSTARMVLERLDAIDLRLTRN